MPNTDLIILMGMGGLFILLGLGGIFWGRREQKGYYDSIAGRSDVREFVEHWPQRPELSALRIGGWIAIVVGVLMLVMGGAFLLWA